MTCINCGMVNHPEAPFCQTCGKQLPALGSRAMSAAVRERMLRCYETKPSQPLQWSDNVKSQPGTWALKSPGAATKNSAD